MEMPGQAAAAAAAPRDSHSAGHKKRKRSAEASRSSSESSSESSSSDERGQEKRRKEKRKKEKRKKEKRKKEKRKKEKRKKEKRKKEPRKSSPVQLSKASCVAFSRAPRQCGLWNEYRVLACSGTESPFVSVQFLEKAGDGSDDDSGSGEVRVHTSRRTLRFLLQTCHTCLVVHRRRCLVGRPDDCRFLLSCRHTLAGSVLCHHGQTHQPQSVRSAIDSAFAPASGHSDRQSV